MNPAALLQQILQQAPHLMKPVEKAIRMGHSVDSIVRKLTRVGGGIGAGMAMSGGGQQGMGIDPQASDITQVGQRRQYEGEQSARKLRKGASLAASLAIGVGVGASLSRAMPLIQQGLKTMAPSQINAAAKLLRGYQTHIQGGGNTPLPSYIKQFGSKIKSPKGKEVMGVLMQAANASQGTPQETPTDLNAFQQDMLSPPYSTPPPRSEKQGIDPWAIMDSIGAGEGTIIPRAIDSIKDPDVLFRTIDNTKVSGIRGSSRNLKRALKLAGIGIPEFFSALKSTPPPVQDRAPEEPQPAEAPVPQGVPPLQQPTLEAPPIEPEAVEEEVEEVSVQPEAPQRQPAPAPTISEKPTTEPEIETSEELKTPQVIEPKKLLTTGQRRLVRSMMDNGQTQKKIIEEVKKKITPDQKKRNKEKYGDVSVDKIIETMILDEKRPKISKVLDVPQGMIQEFEERLPAPGTHSSVLRGFVYQPPKKLLLTYFNDGNVGLYRNVPQSAYKKLDLGEGICKTKGKNDYGCWHIGKSPSQGAVLNKEIKPHYDFIRL